MKIHRSSEREPEEAPSLYYAGCANNQPPDNRNEANISSDAPMFKHIDNVSRDDPGKARDMNNSAVYDDICSTA